MENPEQAPLPFAWGVLYAKPNPDGSRKQCLNCMMWSMRDEKCSIHREGLHVPPDAVCIPPESLILVNGDFKHADEVKEGDLLLTHQNRWRKVTKVIERGYDGSLIRIKAKGMSRIMVTPEHPIYAIRRKSVWDNTAGRNWFPGPYRDILKPEWIEAQDLKVRDVMLLASPIEQPSVKEVNMFGEELKITSEMSRLFGYYLAEGCACKNGKIPFVFANWEKAYVREVVEVGRSVFGVDPSIDERKNMHSISVTFHSKKISEWLSNEFGASCDVKRIPEWLMRQSHKLTREVLIGAWRGDGSFPKIPGVRPEIDTERMTSHYTTTSQRLAEQIALLLRREGFATSIQHHPKPNSRDGSDRLPWSRVYVADQYEQSRLRAMVLDGNHDVQGVGRSRREDGLWRCPVREISLVDYTGKVLNFSVEEDESYTLSGGTVHNCGYHVFGLPMEVRMPHEDLDPVDEKLSGFEIIPGGTSCDICVYYEPTSGTKGLCHAVARSDRHPPQPVQALGCCARWEKIR
ncbi:MAG: hypothetical protein MN733_38460 [Nitrososphaera sp.]|nr:hypothetical protein [Nitrososphaera sp.]